MWEDRWRGGGKQKETARENRRKDKNKSLKQEIGNLGGQPLSMLITSPRNSYWIRKIQFIFPLSLLAFLSHKSSLKFILPLSI